MNHHALYAHGLCGHRGSTRLVYRLGAMAGLTCWFGRLHPKGICLAAPCPRLPQQHHSSAVKAWGPLCGTVLALRDAVNECAAGGSEQASCLHSGLPAREAFVGPWDTAQDGVRQACATSEVRHQAPCGPCLGLTMPCSGQASWWAAPPTPGRWGPGSAGPG